jgi:molybdenum cofactor biosynthesis enzyme MoaA
VSTHLRPQTSRRRAQVSSEDRAELCIEPQVIRCLATSRPMVPHRAFVAGRTFCATCARVRFEVPGLLHVKGLLAGDYTTGAV